MEDEKKVLQGVADTVTQAPVTLSFDVVPANKLHGRLMKWGWLKNKRVFEMRPITYGNLQRISKLLLQIGAERFQAETFMDTAYKLIAESADSVCEIVAIALTNTRQQPSENLKAFLQFNMTPADSVTVLSAVLSQMDIKSFVSGLVALRGLNLLRTAEDEKTAPGL